MRAKYRPGMILCAFAQITVAGCATDEEAPGDVHRVGGAIVGLGQGDVESYAEVDGAGVPLAIGVSFAAAALEGLPTEESDGHRCFDGDADGEIEVDSECSPWHERVLPLPTELSRRQDIPFKWALLNWNNHGHIPPGVWDVPHFDVHFYIESIENVFALQRGPCGPEFLRCDQFELATRAVPSNYMHADFVDVGAAAPAMGNHLIDTTAAEFHGEPFTRSWIYGIYDRRIIFYEEMVARDYLLSRPDDCFLIKTTPAVALSGYYPTSTCTRYDPETDRVTVSLETFEYREASAPEGR